MRTLDPSDLPRWNRIDWERSTEKLSRMVSERASHDWEFTPHFDEDNEVAFSARGGGPGPTDTEEQSRFHADDQQIIRDVFETFEWIVYR
jgi:hypothetical protein